MAWRRTILLALGLAWASFAAWGAGDAVVSGAGATFPVPVLSAWGEQFAREQDISLKYRALGSGEGIRNVTARAVDFALTDIPLTPAELIHDDLLQFPLVVGAIVPVVNLPGLDPEHPLRLTGPLLAAIYFGQITRWNDPTLSALNPTLTLPDIPITVLHREEGSGSTFVFSHYLSKVSPDWRAQVGLGSRLKWPRGEGARGNEGMATAVAAKPGAIAYVEYAYALQHQLRVVSLANAAGQFPRPDEASFQSALDHANWQRTGFYEVLTNKEGEASWPLVGVSYVLIHKNQLDLDDARETMAFFDWVLRQGAPLARERHYLPLQDTALIARIRAAWGDIRTSAGERVWHE